VDVVLRDILVFVTSGSIWRHIRDLVDIGLVAFFLYRMFLLIRGTQAVQLMVGVLLLGLVGLLGFLWSLKSGQYDDMEGAAWRAIADDEPAAQAPPDGPAK